MNATWTNELELKFLEYYKSEPCIWNTKHIGYKEKNKKSEAWDRVSKQMKIPVRDLKRKRDSLLSSFRKYRKIIKDSIDSVAEGGDVYKPIWFAYDYMHSFLGDGSSLPKMTFNPVSKKEPDSQSDDNGHENTPDNEEETYVFYEPTPEPSQTPPLAKRKRTDPPELEEARSYIKQAVNTLNLALKATDTLEDECDLYGKILAGRLRKLSETDRLQLMHDIDGMFLRRQASQPPQGIPSGSASPVNQYAVYIRPNSAHSS